MSAVLCSLLLFSLSPVAWSVDPEPLLLTVPERLLVQEGSSVSLPCDVRNKGSYSVAWFKGMPTANRAVILSLNKLAMIPDNRLSTTDRELTIHNVTLRDASDYVCQVSTTPPLQVIHTLAVVQANGHNGYRPTVPTTTQHNRDSGTSSILNRNGRRMLPLLDNVLIRVNTQPSIERQGQPTQPTAGWSLQAPPQKTQRTGTVVAVGPGARTSTGQTVPMAVREGDEVLLPEGVGIATVVEQQEYFVVREADILAKWSD